MSLRIAQRELISLRLIELVRPHKILYSETKCVEDAKWVHDRRQLWIKIADELNRSFKTNLSRLFSFKSSCAVLMKQKLNTKHFRCRPVEIKMGHHETAVLLSRRKQCEAKKSHLRATRIFAIIRLPKSIHKTTLGGHQK